MSDDNPTTETEHLDLDEVDLSGVARPGLTAFVTDDPGRLAVRIARALDGELASDVEELRRAVLVRLGEGDDERSAEIAGLRERLENAGRAGLRILTDVDGLRDLVRQLERAERIVTGTEAKMAETVGQRLSTGSAVSVHPDTIRDAAARVRESRDHLAAVEAELAEMTPEPQPADSGRAKRSERAEVTVVAWDRRSAFRRAGGVFLASLGIALMLVVLSLWMLAPIIPILALLWGIRFVRSSAEDADDKRQAAANLASVGARTDEMYGDSFGDPDFGMSAQQRLVAGRVDIARERYRTAMSAWTDFVGSEADPDDVDTVLRARDPQYFSAMELVSETSQARAAAAMHRRIQARWRVAWAALDRDPPGLAEAERVIEGLEREGTLVVSVRTWATDDSSERDAIHRRIADLLAEAADAAPLVVIDRGPEAGDEVVDALERAAERSTIVLVSPGDLGER